MLRNFAVFLAVIGTLGCGAEGPKWDLNPHIVTGKVLYDGRPASGVLVGLLPVDAPLPPAVPGNPIGTTGADGTFKLTTFNDGDGACEGSYQILLTWPVPSTSGDEERSKDKLLGWFDAAHSNLRYVVVKGSNTIPTINIPVPEYAPEEVPGIPGRN